MKVIIVSDIESIEQFNAAITPLMLAAEQHMEKWVDAAQCPINSVTGEYAIITECTGIRREVIEKYLKDNNLKETELDPKNSDWFPVNEMPL